MEDKRDTIIILLNRENTGPNFGYKILGAEFNQLGYKTIFLDAHAPDIAAQIKQAYNDHTVAFTLTHNNLNIDLREGDVSLYAHHRSFCISLTDTPLPKYDLIKSAGKNIAILIGDISYKRIIQIINPHIHVYEWIAYNNVYENVDLAPVQDRIIDVLFAGRVGAGAENIKNHPSARRKFGIQLAKKYGFQNEKQIDEVVDMLLQKGTAKLRNKLFLKLNYKKKNTWDYLWNVVQYIRAERRNYVLDELLSLPENIKVMIITDKGQAEKLRQKNSYINVHEFMPWPEVIKHMQNSRIVINALPYQVHSSHERIAVAQYSGAVVLSDKNPYLAKLYSDGEDIGFYDYKKGELASKIMDMLKQENIQQVADKGRQKIVSGHMPAHRAAYIVSVYRDLLNTKPGKIE